MQSLPAQLSKPTTTLSQRAQRIAEAVAEGATLPQMKRELEVDQEEYDQVASLPNFIDYVNRLQHPLAQVEVTEVKDSLDALAPKAVAVLNACMDDQDKRIRQNAAKEVLDRVYPKVIKNENTNTTKITLEAKVLSLAIESAISAAGVDPKTLVGLSQAEVVERLTP